MSALQPVLPDDVALNIEGNTGQVAIGNYIVQIGSVHGGVVNVTMPQEQPRLRPGPVLLRPRRFRNLLDRQTERSTATHVLGMAEPVEFYGRPGLGKTSLLRHLAHQLPLTTGPDGIVYLVAGRQPVTDLLQMLFDAFYETSTPLKATETQLRTALQNKQALIILDDVELSRDHVEHLFDAIPNSIFLLTSAERRLWGEGRAVALPGLPPEDALTLLQRELGQEISAEERPTALALCQTLEGHPLHILQVAALLRERHWSLAEVSRQIQAGELSKLLVATLSPQEEQVVKMLAALGNVPLPLEHMIDLTGLPQPERVLDGLEQRYLVQSHSPRYSLTGDLGSALSQSWDLSSTTTQLIDHFARWAEQHRATPERLQPNIDTLLHLLHRATDVQHWSAAFKLGQAIEGVLALEKRWGAWNQVLRVCLQAADVAGNRAAKAWAYHQLGTQALCLSDTAAAQKLLGRALRLREAMEDWPGAEVTRHNLQVLLGPPPSGGNQTPPDSSLPPNGQPVGVPTPTGAGLGLGSFLIGGLLIIAALVIGLAGYWAMVSQRTE